MNTRFARLLPFVAGLALAAPAFAQVMTPPPATAPKVDENIPKAPPPQPRPAHVTAPAQPQAAQVELPTDVNYDALIQKDETGKVKPITEPIYLAALKANTKLPSDFWEKAKPYLAERRQTMEFVMINNLDLMDQIEDGIFEKTGFDKDAVAKLLATARPLMKPSAPDVVTKELKSRNLIDEVQYRITEKIVRNYTLAANPVPPADKPKEERGDQSFRVLIQFYKIAFDEFVHIHKDLSLTAADNMQNILPQLGADAATSKKVQDAVAKITKKSPDADKMAAMKSLRDVLTLEQRKEVMRQAGAIYQKEHGGQ